MKFSLNWIKQFADIKQPPEKLAELLTLKTAEIEDLEKKGKDVILNAKILPNRGDLLSHFGLAREILAIGGKFIKYPAQAPEEFKSLRIERLISAKVVNGKACPRYSLRIIDGVKVGPSPDWLKQSLEALGLRPINNIVDAANYVMLELGQPLHAFDYSKIAGPEIIVRNAKKGERIKILDEAGTDYELSDDVLIIADAEKPLAIAGIKGGRGSEITSATARIVIESANFSPRLIRQTSEKLRLRTDASLRFSYGLDVNLTLLALDKAASLIQNLAGGRTAYGVVDVYPKRVRPSKLAVTKGQIDSLIGLNIDSSRIIEAMTALGMTVEETAEKFIITTPTFRLDIKTAEDVIEEIARIYGYENIKSRPPLVLAYKEKGSQEEQENQRTLSARELMRDILKGLAFSETYNYSFIGDELKEVLALADAPEIANPASHHFKYLRTGLLPGMIWAAKSNARFRAEQKLFEFGKVFGQKGEAVMESEELAALVTGGQTFWQIKGLMESFLKQLGITDFSFVEGQPAAGARIFHPGRHALIKIGDSPVGELGEINPASQKALGLKGGIGIGMFRFEFTDLVKAFEREIEFEPIPKFPSIIRDISVLVSSGVKISQILNAIEEQNKDGLIKDVDVFDIFEDEDGRNQKKSVAFHVIYRADDRTLSDTEAKALEDKVVATLKEKFDAEIR